MPSVPKTWCVILSLRAKHIPGKKSFELMNTSAGKIGEWGEGIAVEYLEECGYQILIRNYHTSQGEIDIVSVSPDLHPPCLVFVEVKTRSSSKYGYPEEAVDRKKWQRMVKAILHYLEANPDQESEWRVDVIAILGQPEGASPQIQHYENVVMPDERD
jgi:putative endonuclease